MRVCMRMVKYVSVASDDVWRNDIDVAIAGIVEEIQRIKVALLPDKYRKVWHRIEPLVTSKRYIDVDDLAKATGFAMGTARVYIKKFRDVGLIKKFEEHE